MPSANAQTRKRSLQNLLKELRISTTAISVGAATLALEMGKCYVLPGPVTCRLVRECMELGIPRAFKKNETSCEKYTFKEATSHAEVVCGMPTMKERLFSDAACSKIPPRRYGASIASSFQLFTRLPQKDLRRTSASQESLAHL